MKVLLILNGLGNEGVTTIALTYLYELLDSAIKFEVVAAGPCDKNKLSELQDIGVRVYQLPNRKAQTKQYILALAKVIRINKYDAVHIHGNSATMAIDLFVAWLCGCKIRIAHCHNTKCDNEKLNDLLRPFLLLFSTARFACGDAAGKWLYGTKSFEIIQNGREINKYRFDNEKRSVIRKRLGVDDSDILIGHVGTFTYQKNQERLIQILIDLMTDYSEKYKLVLIGDGPNKDTIEKKLSNSGLEDCVVLTGIINSVSDYLSAFDIMMLPSRYEGLPLVAIEWQANGVPCIFSTEVSRECKVLENTSFLSLKDDNKVWIEKMFELLKCGRIDNQHYIDSRMKEMGFDIKDNALRLEKLYKSYLRR